MRPIGRSRRVVVGFAATPRPERCRGDYRGSTGPVASSFAS